MALPDLLAPRGKLQRHNLDVTRVGEVGNRRIIEREVTVLPDTATAQVQRMRAQQRLVTARLGVGVGGVTFEIVELLQREPARDAFAHVPPEAGRVRG